MSSVPSLGDDNVVKRRVAASETRQTDLDNHCDDCDMAWERLGEGRTMVFVVIDGRSSPLVVKRVGGCSGKSGRRCGFAAPTNQRVWLLNPPFPPIRC